MMQRGGTEDGSQRTEQRELEKSNKKGMRPVIIIFKRWGALSAISGPLW